jgi:hypothetical protein
MPGSKLIAILTALSLLGGASRALAAYDLDQLKEIERLVLAKDTQGLGRYLAANPEITIGGDPLAQELRTFLGCARSGALDCFSVRQFRATPTGEPEPPAPPAIY